MGPPIAAMLHRLRFLIITPPTESSCLAPSLFGETGGGSPACRTPGPLSRQNINGAEPIKRSLSPTWCFRRSVAMLQHMRLNAGFYSATTTARHRDGGLASAVRGPTGTNGLRDTP